MAKFAPLKLHKATRRRKLLEVKDDRFESTLRSKKSSKMLVKAVC